MGQARSDRTISAGSASKTGWVMGIPEASGEAANHNKRAALWTAVSILLGIAATKMLAALYELCAVQRIFNL